MKYLILAITGLPGSGKTEVTRCIENQNFARVRFGDVTDNELRKQNLPRTEKNERVVREELRKKHGMAVYALLSLPKIRTAARKGNVVLDGLYSWEEYKLLRKQFPGMILTAVHAPPRLRYARLIHRPERPLTEQEVRSREESELEVLNKGGTIAMADYIIENLGTKKALIEKTRRLIHALLKTKQKE